MHYLVLNILCFMIFTQGLRYAQHCGARDYLVGTVNYVLAAVVSLGALGAMACLAAMPELFPAGALGAACGVSYFGQFLLILVSYRLAGVGITTAATCLGILIPILVSWCFWSEPMTPWRWTAVGLLPMALVLVRPPRSNASHLTWKADLILLGVFLNNGLMNTLHKAVSIYAPAGASGETFLFLQPQQVMYEASLFLLAALCSVGYALWRRGHWGRAELALGSAVGIINVLGTLFAVVGLSVVPAAVFFPTVTCAVIVLSVIVSRILWGERVAPGQLVGLGLAIVIVVLANL